MTQQGFEYLIYFTMLFATVALIWSNRHFIKKNLSSKKDEVVEINEFDTVMKNEAVQFALKWRNHNDGKKQSESVYRENGKTISKSEAYKALRKNVFNIN